MAFTVSTVFKAVDRMSAPINRMQSRISAMTSALTSDFKTLERNTKALANALEKIDASSAAAGLTGAAAVGAMAAANAKAASSMTMAGAAAAGSISGGAKAFSDVADSAKDVDRETRRTSKRSSSAIRVMTAQFALADKTAKGLSETISNSNFEPEVDMDAIFDEFRRARRPIRDFANRIKRMALESKDELKQVARQVDTITNKFKSFGSTVGGITTKAAAGIGLMTHAGLTFEDSLITATAKMPGNVRQGTKAFEEVEAAAAKVGETSIFSGSQAAQGVGYLAQAGFDANQSIAALPGVVSLATVAGVDLANATDIATDALGAFNLMSKDSAQLQTNLTRVNDVLAKTVTSSNTDIVAMFEALKTGAPVATAAGASVEDISTVVAKLADAGIKGEMAGTALKNIFIAMAAPGSEAAKVLRRIGVETVDADGNIRNVLDVFADLKGAVGGLTESQRVGVFESVFGKIPIASAINLTNAAGDSMYEYRDSLLAASGTAEDMAEIIGSSTLNQLKALLSAVESVAIEVFQKWGTSLKDIIVNMTMWIRANKEFIATDIANFLKGIADNIEIIWFRIKTLATVFAVLWTLNTVISAVSGAFAIFNLIMAANPITLFVLAVLAVIAVLGLLVDWFVSNWDIIVGYFKDLFGWVGEAVGWISDLFSSAEDAAKGIDSIPDEKTTTLDVKVKEPDTSQLDDINKKVKEIQPSVITTEVKVAEPNIPEIATPKPSEQVVNQEVKSVQQAVQKSETIWPKPKIVDPEIPSTVKKEIQVEPKTTGSAEIPEMLVKKLIVDEISAKGFTLDVSSSTPMKEPEIPEALDPLQTINTPTIEPKFINAEPAMVEVLNPEPVMVEVLNPEPVMVEVLNPEPVMVEALNPESVMVEVINPEPAMIEASIPEVKVQEPAMVEVINPEPAMVEVINPEPVMVDVITPEPVTIDVISPEPMFDSQVDPEISLIDKAMMILDQLSIIAGSVLSGNQATSSQSVDEQSVSVSSPQERTARYIEERNTTSRSEVVIRDETGRAEVSGRSKGSNLKLISSGDFENGVDF